MSNLLKIVNRNRKIIAYLVIVLMLLFAIAIGAYLQFWKIHETQELADESRIYQKYNVAQNQAVIFLDKQNRILTYTGDRTLFGYNEGEVLGKQLITLFNCVDRVYGEPILSCRIHKKDGTTEDVIKTITVFVNTDVSGVKSVAMFQRKRK